MESVQPPLKPVSKEPEAKTEGQLETGLVCIISYNTVPYKFCGLS